jgi:hypothetical protein
MGSLGDDSEDGPGALLGGPPLPRGPFPSPCQNSILHTADVRLIYIWRQPERILCDGRVRARAGLLAYGQGPALGVGRSGSPWVGRCCSPEGMGLRLWVQVRVA